MRVLVVRTGSLFAHDDTRLYATRLCSAITALGHSVELATIPYSGSVADLVPQITAAIDCSTCATAVISALRSALSPTPLPMATGESGRSTSTTPSTLYGEPTSAQ